MLCVLSAIELDKGKSKVLAVILVIIGGALKWFTQVANAPLFSEPPKPNALAYLLKVDFPQDTNLLSNA